MVVAFLFHPFGFPGKVRAAFLRHGPVPEDELAGFGRGRRTPPYGRGGERPRRNLFGFLVVAIVQQDISAGLGVASGLLPLLVGAE